MVVVVAARGTGMVLVRVLCWRAGSVNGGMHAPACTVWLALALARIAVADLAFAKVALLLPFELARTGVVAGDVGPWAHALVVVHACASAAGTRVCG